MAPTEKNSALRFRWLGAAGIELAADGAILAIDPFFTRPPVWRLLAGRTTPNRTFAVNALPRCGYILVSHAHYDHLMDVPDIARATGAMALGSANACRLLIACGLPPAQVREIRVGDKLALGPFQIEVQPLKHVHVPGFGPGVLSPGLQPPLRIREYRMDDCFSFFICAGGLRLLHSGSVNPFPTAQADVLFTGLSGDSACMTALLAKVSPELVVPIHWDDLFRPLTRAVRPMLGPPVWAMPPLQTMNPYRFKCAVESNGAGSRVLVPELFHVYTIQISGKRTGEQNVLVS